MDCQVTQWSDWGSCTSTCGGGVKTRDRTVTVNAAYSGAACPALADSSSCSTDACPVDCQVTQWSAWGDCSKTCGSGVKTRDRTVTVNAAYSGAACPALADSSSCSTDACPVDCQVTQWSAFGSCSTTCGSGVKTRTRAVTVNAAYSGAACPALADSSSCSTDACPVDCTVSAWSAWGACSTTCGAGSVKTRSRAVIVAAAYSGAACPALSDTTASGCSTDPCPPQLWSDDSAHILGKLGQMRTDIAAVISDMEEYETRLSAASAAAADLRVVDTLPPVIGALETQISSLSAAKSGCGREHCC